MKITVTHMDDETAHKKMCERARLIFKNAASFAKAALRGMVTEDVQAIRILECKACDMLCTDEKGMYCGMCGCNTGGTGLIADLTKYREGEREDEKLCTHPRRPMNDGGWKQ